MRPYLRTIGLLALLIMAGCAPLLEPTPSPLPAEPTTAIVPATATADLRSTASSGPLRLWLPPFLDPASGTAAGDLLAERLEAFSQQYPELPIDVRVKAELGPAGLLESLRVATAAAPSTLPDIIALDPAGLHTAALKGLIAPQTDILPAPDEDIWYPVAADAAYIDDVLYGAPFASDALFFCYRASAYENRPVSWSALIESDRSFLFPAGDPQAVFTLALYQSLGGSLAGPSGRPSLDPEVLSAVLAFYVSARVAGVLPTSVSSMTSADQTWQTLFEGRADSATAMLHSFLRPPRAQFLAAAPLPTRMGDGVALTSTWSWALVAVDPVRQAAAAELVRWLGDPAFLGPWTQALGLMPPTAAALQAWTTPEDASAVADLAEASLARPSEELLAIFGPPLQQAVQAVLTAGASADAAAFDAAQSLSTQ